MLGEFGANCGKLAGSDIGTRFGTEKTALFHLSEFIAGGVFMGNYSTNDTRAHNK